MSEDFDPPRCGRYRMTLLDPAVVLAIPMRNGSTLHAFGAAMLSRPGGKATMMIRFIELTDKVGFTTSN